MTIEEIISLGSFPFYMAIGLFLIKPKVFNYDVLQMELRLFPHFFKWVGVILCLVILIMGRLYWEVYEYTKELTFYAINLGLLVVVFSKEKIEDEFAHQLRLKSLIVSVIGTIIMLGSLYPMYVFYVFESKLWLSRVSAPFVLSMLLSSYLFYFYYARFRLRRENI